MTVSPACRPSAAIPSMSAGRPWRCTGTIACVRGVTRLAASETSMLYVAGSTSANTGVAPACRTAWAVAMNPSAGTITSSPGPTPAAASATWSAEVPLFVARQKRAPTTAANSASSARISGAPAPESTPRSRTRVTAARSAWVKIGHRRRVTTPLALVLRPLLSPWFRALPLRLTPESSFVMINDGPNGNGTVRRARPRSPRADPEEVALPIRAQTDGKEFLDPPHAKGRAALRPPRSCYLSRSEPTAGAHRRGTHGRRPRRRHRRDPAPAGTSERGPPSDRGAQDQVPADGVERAQAPSRRRELARGSGADQVSPPPDRAGTGTPLRPYPRCPVRDPSVDLLLGRSAGGARGLRRFLSPAGDRRRRRNSQCPSLQPLSARGRSL